MRYLLFSIIFNCYNLNAQVIWQNMDSIFSPLPAGFHVYNTSTKIDNEPFIAWYAVADIGSKKLHFETDTTLNRRLTPSEFYSKNNQPLLVVNTTFFSFETNRSLNLVIKNGKLVSQNITSVPLKGKDTFMFKHPFTGSFGISKKRMADIAWTYTDSSLPVAYAIQMVSKPVMDSLSPITLPIARQYVLANGALTHHKKTSLKKWKMETAVGGGPVLVQNGKVAITNNEEMKFAGKGLHDKHPRTLIGYTKDQKLIVMVIEGRNPGKAMGANLEQAAELMMQLGCVEALNLDGGGSSCMLINGIETIYPSDKGQQRPVPAVFIINK